MGFWSLISLLLDLQIELCGSVDSISEKKFAKWVSVDFFFEETVFMPDRYI
jgi:hypothetical protein